MVAIVEVASSDLTANGPQRFYGGSGVDEAGHEASACGRPVLPVRSSKRPHPPTATLGGKGRAGVVQRPTSHWRPPTALLSCLVGRLIHVLEKLSRIASPRESTLEMPGKCRPGESSVVEIPSVVGSGVSMPVMTAVPLVMTDDQRAELD
jgi:hypothetical protein